MVRNQKRKRGAEDDDAVGVKNASSLQSSSESESESESQSLSEAILDLCSKRGAEKSC